MTGLIFSLSLSIFPPPMCLSGPHELDYILAICCLLIGEHYPRNDDQDNFIHLFAEEERIIYRYVYIFYKIYELGLNYIMYFPAKLKLGLGSLIQLSSRFVKSAKLGLARIK